MLLSLSTSSFVVCSGQWLRQLGATWGRSWSCPTTPGAGALERSSPAAVLHEGPDTAHGSEPDPPRHRSGAFIVTPQTLLRWHRELIRRK
jgi:hypothetical protein